MILKMTIQNNIKGVKLKEDMQFVVVYTNILRILPRFTLKLIVPCKPHVLASAVDGLMYQILFNGFVLFEQYPTRTAELMNRTNYMLQ